MLGWSWLCCDEGCCVSDSVRVPWCPVRFCLLARSNRGLFVLVLNQKRGIPPRPPAVILIPQPNETWRGSSF